MTNFDLDTPPLEAPEHELEAAFIAEYLQSQGHNMASARALPHDKATELLAAASTYASGKLMEVEARAHFVHELHGQH